VPAARRILGPGPLTGRGRHSAAQARPGRGRAATRVVVVRAITEAGDPAAAAVAAVAAVAAAAFAARLR
jgi:hypothetical protein